MKEVDNTVREIVYEFLDELRVSDDAPNMAGAWQDLRDEFGFDKATAKKLLGDWIKQFGKEDK